MKKALLFLAPLLYFGVAYIRQGRAFADGDITAVRIASAAAHNGFVAEIDITSVGATPGVGGTYTMGLGADNNPSTAKIVFTLTSLGYDNTGASTTIVRTVYGTFPVRKAYPDQATNDEAEAANVLTVRVALSEFIYDPDTSVTVTIASGFYSQGGTPTNSVTGLSVTNNSTLAYPKAIGHFVSEQRRPVNGTSVVEVFAVHKFGKDGKPLAAVKITATGVTSLTVKTATVTAMTLSARGDNIPVYAASLDLSTGGGFTRGELVNINFTAYPWVGDSGATLDSTTDAGTQIYQLGLLKWTIMDKMIAVVDTAGNDGTCVASLTQATADASPCLTISGALTVIAAKNNTDYTLNRTDGSEVQVKAGTWKTGKYSTQAVTNGYFTITPHSSTNRAGVIFDGYVTSQSQYKFQRYYNVTFTRAINEFVVFAANGDVLVMESVNFTDAHAGWYSGDTDTNIEFLDCTTTNSNFSKGGNDGHSRLNRNNSYSALTGTALIFSNASCVIGSDVSGGTHILWQILAATAQSNIVIAFNTALNKSDGIFINANATAVTNMAIINNLFERTGASADPMSEISDANHSNVLAWHNTYAGQRWNHENDIVAPYVNKSFTNWGGKFNCFNARGDHRADINDADGAMTGTWSVGYSVGWDGNRNEAISYSGDTDFWGIRSNTDTGTSITPSEPIGYVADRSRGGSDVGNGDYHLSSTATALNLVPAGGAVLPFDLSGVARRNNGTGAAGAYEFPMYRSSMTLLKVGE